MVIIDYHLAMFKKCSIEGCEREELARGFCQKHYHRFWKHGNPNINKREHEDKCLIEGCENKYYAKGLCKQHYEKNVQRKKGLPKPPMWGVDGARYKDRAINKPCKHESCLNPHWQHGYCRLHWSRVIRLGTSYLPTKPPKTDNCIVEGCQKKPHQKGYCSTHYYRFKNGLPINATRHELYSGEKNPNWKGGVAEYPNHSLMKRIRLIVLKRDNYTCVYCSKTTKGIHHIDQTRTNHTEKNMVACCNSCNLKRAKKHKVHMSKYRKLYGFSLIEMRKAHWAYKRMLKSQLMEAA